VLAANSGPRSTQSLSGGECQRSRLASELHKKGSVDVMDEPTTGLHMSDIGHLLAIMNQLVEGGNTVVVIEHNLDVIRNADWIIDMGPERGSKGGKVMFEGRQAAPHRQAITDERAPRRSAPPLRVDQRSQKAEKPRTKPRTASEQE